MRIMVKGGVWKNTEDEILKAAVMKYGKNQWARISSLLTRKTAKQCKSRWYEWLDPSIKKTEWSREEEEKLLHLAKIMPNQWKTIAPIIGRTAAQCIEHYEKLLDAAQLKDESFDPSEDPRRLRPGEIDPNPEAKPARPDPVDMDEDEKEMLSEARARLANTKGKKAKRKARERKLEEARRLASLQKRRELKAAGIDLPKHRKKLKGIDYNKDIPFQKKPAPGFYEVDWDSETAAKPDFKTLSRDINDANKRKREEEESRGERKKPKKDKEKDSKKIPDAIVQINKLAEQDKMKRSKLMLPSPQLDEEQLQDLARAESGGDVDEATLSARNEGAAFTKSLLPSMSATPGAYNRSSALRTPMRTPAREDLVMKEAQNLVALTASQTPLAGGENPNLHNSDFSGATPRHIEPKTPNALALASSTPARPGQKRDFFTPLRTPLRDALSDKEDIGRNKAEQAAMRRSVQAGLKSLPKPQNEYQVSLPNAPEDEDDGDAAAGEDDDASGILMKQQREREEREAERLRLRSSALKRTELPRPISVPSLFADFKSRSDDPMIQMAEEMLRREMIMLISYEAIEYPFKQSKFRESDELESYGETFTESDLANAQQLLDAEVESYKKDNYPQGFSTEEFDQAWRECYEEEVYVSSSKKIGRMAAMSKKEVLDVMSSEFDLHKSATERESAKASKIVERIGILFGGYQKRAGTVLTQISDTYKQLDQSMIELQCFTRLRELEKAAVPSRVEKLKAIVQEQQEREAENQKRYLNLVTEKENLLVNA